MKTDNKDAWQYSEYCSCTKCQEERINRLAQEFNVSRETFDELISYIKEELK